MTFREQWNDERLGYIDNTDGKILLYAQWNDHISKILGTFLVVK